MQGGGGTRPPNKNFFKKGGGLRGEKKKGGFFRGFLFGQGGFFFFFFAVEVGLNFSFNFGKALFVGPGRVWKRKFILTGGKGTEGIFFESNLFGFSISFGFLGKGDPRTHWIFLPGGRGPGWEEKGKFRS